MSVNPAEICFADRAVHQQVRVVENVPLARNTFRIRLECPAMATQIVPGQFIMLRLPDCDDPLLARPLALYDTVLDGSGEATGIDVVYLVIGKMTTRLAAFQAGQTLDIWGPLGNGFPPQNGGHLIMVAGGIGQTPFMAMARESLGKRSYRTPHRQATPATSVTLCYGARQADYLAGVEDFRTLGVDVRVSTDDGSAGHHGLVTDLLSTVLNERAAAQTLRDSRIICCGPEKMMQAVADIAKQRGVACQVSLETPMACGIGICFSCVTRVRQGDGQWDYRRTCVEGPVFDAAEIVWQA